MENNKIIMQGSVVFVFDATKDRSGKEIRNMIDSVRSNGGFLRGGDTLIMLGVLHKVQHPMGYQVEVFPDSFLGMNLAAMKDEVSRKIDIYVKMLQPSARICENERVDIEVKITAGTPLKNVVLQEVTNCNPTWVILDRYFRSDLWNFLKQISAKVAIVQDNLSIKVMKDQTTMDADNVEHKLVFTMSKPVSFSSVCNKENTEPQSLISSASCSLSTSSLESSYALKTNASSPFMSKSRDSIFSSSGISSSSKQEKSDEEWLPIDRVILFLYINSQEHQMGSKIPTIVRKQLKSHNNQQTPNGPLLCSICGIKSELHMRDAMKFSFSEIQQATNNFSSKNLLGEGGFGKVYKGELRDGQTIAAKMRKEGSTQGFAEFHSEIYVLSFARHKNIVMLLGYCCKENLNILVYEYICNESLDWHLYEGANVLEWDKRHAIAIGTAKGLRYLHEECRGSPIIHRDVRPCNILLTHEFVPMLSDFGLAKWKTGESPIQTRILGAFGYLAPEYAENGIVSARTDVYSFGIVLLQLISGRKAVESDREDQQQSLRQWAEPLIEKLALHKLIDPRIGESYDTYALYNMARTAYLCVQSDPELRPSMGEVLRLLEDNDNVESLVEQFIPHFTR